MYRVATPAPDWIDLAPGIRGRFRHGPSEALVFARRFARGLVEADPRTDPQFAFVAGCVVWGLVEWEGLGAPLPDGVEEDGEAAPLELTADNVLAVLRGRPDIYDAADLDYVETILSARAEKNGSGPSLNGTSAAARPSATPAATAKSAPIEPKSPARKRGGKSGASSKAAPAS